MLKLFLNYGKRGSKKINNRAFNIHRGFSPSHVAIAAARSSTHTESRDLYSALQTARRKNDLLNFAERNTHTHTHIHTKCARRNLVCCCWGEGGGGSRLITIDARAFATGLKVFQVFFFSFVSLLLLDIMSLTHIEKKHTHNYLCKIFLYYLITILMCMNEYFLLN